MKLHKIDGGKAEVEFCLFAQNGNESGFLERFTREDVAVEPVFMARDGDLKAERETETDKVGARFRVVIKPKVTKKATKKPTDD